MVGQIYRFMSLNVYLLCVPLDMTVVRVGICPIPKLDIWIRLFFPLFDGKKLNHKKNCILTWMEDRSDLFPLTPVNLKCIVKIILAFHANELCKMLYVWSFMTHFHMTSLRIKDGNAEALYPRSSFTINCTGKVSFSCVFCVYYFVCLEIPLFLFTISLLLLWFFILMLAFLFHLAGDVCKGDTVLFTQKVYKK